MNLKIFYQDNYLLVIDKPPGLVTDPSETQSSTTLAEILKTEFGISLNRGGIVHRLDKDTSGLLLIAKTQDCLERLQSQFKNRTIQKQYLTLVHGFLEKPGRIEASIARNPQNREKFTVLSDGKEAVTEYEPKGNFKFLSASWRIIFSDYNKIQLRKLEKMNYNQFTFLRCFPKTGRTHQIRVHLKYIGSPIVGDEKYAGRKIARLDKRWCPRQFLHASRLEFIHPITGKKMIVESPLPEDLKKALSHLEQIKTKSV